ncbi:putative ATP-dependent helicase Lhr [Posidoniimonas polymericola]|uniref:Putative ATP-dependent helicase Lhr n=1 Tax=Posidoniimonas polymericola TaxID=2528002 RepID=A0A5C5YQS1_9BACT|nr:DEAD/DEAH box helicase [Posidoniimonas polymericola]TWT77265.1 putative ATP-dependent helicase Lhr [Posidoniimonas polymericola]
MSKPTPIDADPLDSFYEPTRTWFRESFAGPTKAQQLAWPAIGSGESTLLLAPTGSGKTLAAFLSLLDRLMFDPSAPSPTKGSRKADRHVRVLYLSPLKALGVDIDRNLRAPIAGLRAAAERSGRNFRVPEIAIRTGDTDQRERQRIARNPPDILITTPESLYLMLTSKASGILSRVETVIIDEIHVMVPSKRGAHLFLTLERLERLRRLAADNDQRSYQPLQRVGLSATQRPLDEVARLLGGAETTADPEEPARPRPVRVVDASEPKRLEIRVEVPVEDMARLAQPMHTFLGDDEVDETRQAKYASGFDEAADGKPAEPAPAAPAENANTAMGPSTPSIWPALHPRLLELIQQHRSTMIFVNSRRLAERLAAAINELANEELNKNQPDDAPPTAPVEICLAHHGSVAKDKRAEIEDRLKRGQLPAIIATSSLELGIDMGAVDLVIQIEAPPTIASGVQRIGRSGRGVDLLSNGIIFPKYRGDLLACAGATGRMLAGHVEETYYPRNPLDVLAQQMVALISDGPIEVDELYATVRGAASFAELPRTSFDSVLDLLSGRYPSDEFAELRPRVTWDRVQGVVSPRNTSRRIAVLNGGTIPDRGLYGVFLVGDGPGGTGGSRVGELDEEMVFETHAGDVFLLGASSWRVLEIDKDRVLVAPAPGEPGKMPFWRGDGPGRPLEFGRAIGRLAGELAHGDADAMHDQLTTRHALGEKAARNLIEYIRDQAEATGEPPSDKAVIIESFLDEIGDWRVCVLSPLGSRVHAPWAMAIAARLRQEDLGEVDYSWSDDGMIFRLPESPEPPPVEFFVPSSSEVEDMVTSQVGSTAMFAARFRENAARALLLPKRQPGRRSPLWMQRRRAADLLAVAARYPSFPILLETYRECLRDVFDLPGLIGVLRDIERRAVRVEEVRSQQPSPFAASLLFNYVGNFVYEGDAPLAERRAQALALDHSQLRELLGGDEMRDLLSGEVIDQVALELQRLVEPTCRSADAVHDLLLSLGDQTADELWARCDHQAADRSALDAWLAELQAARRIILVRIAGEQRYAAAEDAARLRDALGVAPPAGLPGAFLESVAAPLGDLLSRYARTHAPFTAAEAAARFALGEAPVRTALEQLREAGRVVEGEFLPGRRGREWCDAGVLRIIKRRSLAALRQQVEAVPTEAYARFLPVWQGVTNRRAGPDGVLDAVEQLQGAPLAASVLETQILPARVKDYQPGLLDELFVAGEVAWQGLESVGVSDGRVSLYLPDQLPLLGRLPVADDPQEDPLAARLLELFTERGALFFDELCRATGSFPNDLLAALWRLVWRGQVTNDTLAPLRSLIGSGGSGSREAVGAATRRGRRAYRSRRRQRLPGSEGRWSLLPLADAEPATPTQRAAALAAQLIERHGVLTREQISREQIEGGFSAVYPVLKAMEEAGKIRRGYFVEGQGGAQFAASGADDLLRSAPKDDEPTLLLAATDPANAYGAALPWPAAEDESARPQRTAGARVVLLGGDLLGYLSRGDRALTTFLSADEARRATQAKRLAECLAEESHRRRSLLIEEIDKRPAITSPLSQAFVAAGFSPTTRGLLCRSDFMAGGKRDRWTRSLDDASELPANPR